MSISLSKANTLYSALMVQLYNTTKTVLVTQEVPYEFTEADDTSDKAKDFYKAMNKEYGIIFTEGTVTPVSDPKEKFTDYEKFLKDSYSGPNEGKLKEYSAPVELKTFDEVKVEVTENDTDLTKADIKISGLVKNTKVVIQYLDKEIELDSKGKTFVKTTVDETEDPSKMQANAILSAEGYEVKELTFDIPLLTSKEKEDKEKKG